MRSLAIFVVILLIIVGAAAVFLVATTPRQSTPVHVTPALIQDVPASADEFAIIPSAAAFDAKLTANPITRAALEKWRAQHSLPRPWMVGGADLLVWKSVGTTRYFVRLDPFRAFIVRIFGHARVAEEVKLHIIVLRDLMQQVIEVPADPGERLVKRPDVDADAHPRFRTRGTAKRAADSIGKRMAQSVKDGPEHRIAFNPERSEGSTEAPRSRSSLRLG